MKCRLMVGVALAALGTLASIGYGQSYRTYTEIGQLLLDAETNYPALAKRYNLGTSVNRKPIWALRISDNIGVNEDEPEVHYISTIHGDEWVGNEMMLYLIDHLLSNYGVDPECTKLVDELDLWIVPVMNPDGFDRSSPTRYNANGLDLNRSFPEWTDGDPNTTSGKQAEVAVIMNFVEAHSFSLAANFHTGALLANYPYDDNDVGSTYAASPDDDLYIYISEEYSQHNLPMWNGAFYHGITNGADWYEVSHGMQDWCYRYYGCNHVTMELSNTKLPSASTIPGFWNDNRQSLKSYLATALIGVRGIVTDYNGNPLAATVKVIGRDGADVYTDPEIGDYHRMLLPGTYTLRFEVDGEIPQEIEVVVGSGDATRLDVVMGEPSTDLVSPLGDSSVELGRPTPVTWTGSALREYQVQHTSNYAVSTLEDGFESGSLDAAFATGGTADWFVGQNVVHTGAYSAQSGDVNHLQTSWMERTAQGGTLRFWYLVSSENNYDYFNFYVDGTREIHASGFGSWVEYSTVLAAGAHTLRWEYVKDESVNGGQDTVYIDDFQIEDDTTDWQDLAAATAAGATEVPWTPEELGDAHRVRVRSILSADAFGEWSASDVFSVVIPAANADFDNDGDVDLRDFAALARCTGSGVDGACAATFDVDEDGDVDSVDLNSFRMLLDLSGPAAE